MDDDDDAPPGVPEWVVTYGDMMSLLLTFFIMLVSMSEISEKSRYREVLASLHDRLGYPGGARSAPGNELAGTASDSPDANAGVPPVSAPGPGGTPRPNSPGARPMLTRARAGRPISAGPPVRFAPAADRPSAEQGAALDALATAIKGKLQTVELRGFAAPQADGVPDDALAHHRTRAVLDELVARGVRSGRFRLRTGGIVAHRSASAGAADRTVGDSTGGDGTDGDRTGGTGDAPSPDRVEVWVLDRLAAVPRSGR